VILATAIINTSLCGFHAYYYYNKNSKIKSR
jgi:hypothetical protein